MNHLKKTRELKMKYFRIGIIIFVVCVCSINAQRTCPTGKQSTQSPCNYLKPCPLGSICYRKDDERFCCGELDKFCPTKMYAINWEKSGSYLWGPSRHTSNKKEWYNVSMGTEIISCPIPHSFAYISFYNLAVLPIDFEPSKTSKPKECKVNAECNTENDEFCGAPTHPTYDNKVDRSGKDGAPLGFCYKFQDFGYTNAKPVINANKKELTGCDNNSECLPDGGTESFCLIKKGKNGNVVRIADDNGNVTVKNGFCAKAHVCDLAQHGSIIASLSKDNDFCFKNEDCKGSVTAKEYPGLDPECLTVFNVNVKMCCYAIIQKCEVGTVDHPIKTCSNFENCNSGGNETVMNKWCDEKINHCCQDKENNLWSCPDGATPLFNEPKCDGYSSSDIESGKCSKDGGVCRNGHCCPPLVRKNTDDFSLAKNNYITNMACKSDEPIPSNFHYAFCDPNSKKIVIIGTHTVNGDAIVKDGNNCTLNTDCKRDEVCVRQILDERRCVLNPLKERFEEYRSPMMRIVVSVLCWTILIIILVLLIHFIVRYCAHYEKSDEQPERSDESKPRNYDVFRFRNQKCDHCGAASSGDEVNERNKK